jgi:hypothetical protein
MSPTYPKFRGKVMSLNIREPLLLFANWSHQSIQQTRCPCMEVSFERQIILLPYRLPQVTATGYMVYLYVNI